MSAASETGAAANKVTDYNRFIGKVSSKREPSAIRSLAPLLKIPGMISLGAGNPNPDTFPFASLSYTLKDGSKIDISNEDLNVAFQYSATPGIPDFHEWLKQFQQRMHAPRYSDWDLCVSTGSQDALSKAFDMLVQEGDSMLIEDPSYSGAIAALRPLGPHLIEMPTDQHGIIPEKLEEILSNWSTLHPGKPFPKVMHSIPTGHNPSGATLSADRKRQIYALASKYDLLILEDDPYYYMYFGENQPASFFSMDVDGRVLRFDSLSKILSSGLRLGFVTGPRPLVDRINLHMQTSVLHTSGVSQAITSSLLKHWGVDGFLQHIKSMQQFYRQKRDAFLSLAEKHLTGLAEWNAPSAGMFVWIKLHGVEDSKSLIEGKARDKKVILVPGQVFQPNDKRGPFVRASFSMVSEEAMDEALARLAELLKEVKKQQ